MVMARLAPMPPKAVPVSRAPRARATEPSSKQEHDREEVGRPPEGGIGGEQRGDDGDDHGRGRPTRAAPGRTPSSPGRAGSAPCAGQLAQVEQGLADRAGRPGPPGGSAPCASDPTSSGPPEHHAQHLEQRRSPTTEATGQCGVIRRPPAPRRAPPGRRPGSGARCRWAPGGRALPTSARPTGGWAIAVALEGVVERGVERGRLDVVARLGGMADVEVVRRSQHVLEHPRQRLAERRRRVLHAGGLQLPPASPRLGAPNRPALDRPVERRPPASPRLRARGRAAPGRARRGRPRAPPASRRPTGLGLAVAGDAAGRVDHDGDDQKGGHPEDQAQRGQDPGADPHRPGRTSPACGGRLAPGLAEQPDADGLDERQGASSHR